MTREMYIMSYLVSLRDNRSYSIGYQGKDQVLCHNNVFKLFHFSES